MRAHPTPRGAALAALLAAGCSGGATVPDRPRAEPMVSGFARMAAGTLSEGPPAGAALPPGREGPPPWPSQPVQGFSGAVASGDDELWLLADNGFGALETSGDFLLRIYRVSVGFRDHSLQVLAHVGLHDPAGRLGFPLARPDAGGALTGADLDPESLVRLPDGTFLVGDERGPFVLHVGSGGELLAPPLPVPVPPWAKGFARGLAELRSPDHPALAGLDANARLAAANVARSKGVEGLAYQAGALFAYVVLESPLVDDPDRTRVPVLELDVGRMTFTGRTWWHRLDQPGLSIGDAAAFGGQTLVLIERDDGEGEKARTKRLYEVRLDRAAADGRLEKRLVADLLALPDPDGHGPSKAGVLAMPQTCIEWLVVQGARTLLVGTDNNLPFGRARGESPEESEAVRIELPQALR